MDSDYAQAYRRLYEHHWWWRSREETVARAIEGLALPASPRILDVGCGDGLFFSRLERLGEVEGIEPDARVVSAETLSTRRIYVQPLDDSFRPGKRYHLVLMLDVLEHLPDPRAALARIVELLLPGGHLVVTVPASLALWTNHDLVNRHRTRYARRELRGQLEGAGLEVTDLRRLFAWPALGKLAVRLVEGARPAAPRPPRLPAAPLNALLLALTRLDLRLGMALRLPVGSSLFALARAPRETEP